MRDCTNIGMKNKKKESTRPTRARYPYTAPPQSIDNFWLVICPLSMLAMFIFASIPMMDNRSIERRPDYEEYMKKTPALIPNLFK